VVECVWSGGNGSGGDLKKLHNYRLDFASVSS